MPRHTLKGVKNFQIKIYLKIKSITLSKHLKKYIQNKMETFFDTDKFEEDLLKIRSSDGFTSPLKMAVCVVCGSLSTKIDINGLGLRDSLKTGEIIEMMGFEGSHISKSRS